MQEKMLSVFGQIWNSELNNNEDTTTTESHILQLPIHFKHTVQQKYSMQPDFQTMPHTVFSTRHRLVLLLRVAWTWQRNCMASTQLSTLPSVIHQSCLKCTHTMWVNSQNSLLHVRSQKTKLWMAILSFLWPTSAPAGKYFDSRFRQTTCHSHSANSMLTTISLYNPIQYQQLKRQHNPQTSHQKGYRTAEIHSEE